MERPKPMTGNLRYVKIWVLITLCSLFVYSLYWLLININYVGGVYSGPGRIVDPYFYRLSSLLGVVLRFLGVFLALLALYLFWRHKASSFLKVKSLVSVALLFEGLYYLSFLPSIPRLIFFGYFVSLAVSYSLQILLTFPLLTILFLKIRLSRDAFVNTDTLKWIGAASLGYIAALWVNNVFRWFDMVGTYGIGFIFEGVTYVGFLNGILILSLSVVFAFAGYFTLRKKGTINTKWWGLSLIMVGLHFLIYILYSAYFNALNFAILNEVWTIPLLGLGLAILRLKIEPTNQ
jgi:hypothetical protein